MRQQIERYFQLLVCEDNRADVLLVKHALTLHQTPVRVHLAANGDEAVDFLERAERDDDAPSPEIVLLDLRSQKAFCEHPPFLAGAPLRSRL